MLRIFILLVFLFFNLIQSQVINIPDPNLKAKLLEADVDNTIACIGQIGSPEVYCVKIDLNNNNEIEVSEVQNINYLLIFSANISDLTGIEHFSSLKYLFCSFNNLTTLDNVVNLTQLERIFCTHNQLSTINLTKLSQLKILGCWNNQITSLDFSNNSLLETVYCHNNLISTLDFSNNILFKDLGCQNNPNLTSINIKNDTPQLFGSQTLYNQCWSGCPNLTSICADEFEIEPLQTYLTSCGVNTNGIVINDTCVFSVNDFALQDVMISPNPTSRLINIKFNDNKSYSFEVKIVTMLGQKVYETYLSDSNETQLDLSSFAKGAYLLKMSNTNQTISKRIIIK